MSGLSVLFTLSDSSSEQCKCALAEVLSYHLPGGIQENHKNSWSQLPVSEPGPELGTFQLAVLGHYCNISLLSQ